MYVVDIFRTSLDMCACLSDRTCKIWDLSNSEEILTLDGHPNNVVGVQYAEVTSLIYTVSAYVIKVWDPRRGNVCIKTLTLVAVSTRFCHCLVWLYPVHYTLNQVGSWTCCIVHISEVCLQVCLDKMCDCFIGMNVRKPNSLNREHCHLVQRS